MTIFYDHQQTETLALSKNKCEDEQNKTLKDNGPTPFQCHHCSQSIMDKFYYSVGGLTWHSTCLRCHGCKVSLCNMRLCFSRNEKIWCRQDYNRQFRCQKCFEILKPSDLIMRSGSTGLPYHVGCFRCDLCNVLLLSGDPYGCSGSRLFCKTDFVSSLKGEAVRPPSSLPPFYPDNTGQNIMETVPSNPLSALCQLSMDEYIKGKMSSPTNSIGLDKVSVLEPSTEGHRLVTKEDDNNSTVKEYTPLRSCLSVSSNKLSYEDSTLFNDLSEGQTKAEILLKSEKVTSPQSNYDQDEKNGEDSGESNEQSSMTDLGKDAIDHNSQHEASTFGTEDDDVSGAASCSGDSEDKMAHSSKQGITKKGSNNLRQKRVRTSFKHQQLRTMKAYFAMNHNPDSKDLRQLSQKTGLSKRVLQVWFQNARAKFRRSLCRQSGLICPASSNQMQMPNVFDESLMQMDKNGNYSTKSKITAFTDISSSILNHSISTNHRHCTISDMGYPVSNSNDSLLPSLTNIRDRYLQNSKQFIPTSNNNYYNNNPMNFTSQNSPSIFAMDVGNLVNNLSLPDFARDSVDSFHLTEIGMGQKLSSSM